MAEIQAPPDVNVFCWNELMTRDETRAQSFYSELFGWSFRQADMGPSGSYTIFRNQGKDAAGCLRIQPSMGPLPPHWMSYVSVPDVDATAKKVVELGGRLITPPTDIPNIGRFIVFVDPTGAALSAITLR